MRRRAIRAMPFSPAYASRQPALPHPHGVASLRKSTLRESSKREFRWPAHLAAAYGFDAPRPPDLLSVVNALRPTVLIGTTGEASCFHEQVVRAMAAHCDRPAIFPFSNPTSKSEAIPSDLLQWTNGRVLIATGSPFAAFPFGGRSIRVAQGNNVYVFPGVGLGAMVAEAHEVNDEMFAAAATALAECATVEDSEAGVLYPPLRQLRPITARVATAVAIAARETGAGRAIADEAILEAVTAAMRMPSYPRLTTSPRPVITPTSASFIAATETPISASSRIGNIQRMS